MLVRHGHAGSKASWTADDLLRPLSALGLTQAAALVPVISAFELARIISSPMLRCLQTVGPLASATGLRIERSDWLLPDAGSEAASLIRQLASSAKSIVLCTHGEAIEDVQRHLGTRAPANFRNAPIREKGSVWVLSGNSRGITRAQYLPPPS